MSDGGTRADEDVVSEIVHRPSRLRALANLSANAESSAEALDRIAAVACRVLEAPVAIVNLVGSDTQHFIGCGDPDFELREMPVDVGFCPFALGAEKAYAFADAHADPALAANPVVEDLGVVAYAGVPLRDAAGEPVGTLCALDTRPHDWSEDDLTTLSDLAASAVSELQLLAATRHAARQQSRMDQLADLGDALAGATGPDEVAERVLPVVRRLGATSVTVAPDDPGTLQIGFEDDGELEAEDHAHLRAVAAMAGLALAR